MFRQIWSIAATEARMACRTWRFWLSVILLSGIVYLAWKDHVAFVESVMFLSADHSCGNRAYFKQDVGRSWIRIPVHNYGAVLSVVITWISGVALALDSCARLSRTRMDKILFPRPFSTITFILGRYFGILSVMIPLAAIPWIGFGAIQSLYGHGDVVWQPFILACLCIVIPVLLSLTALGLWFRSVFKHDLLALFAMAIVVILFWALSPDIIDIMFRNWEALVGASPSLGARIEIVDQGPGYLVAGLLTVFFLVMAPFHLRRQEPQRRILKRRGYRWFAIPTFLRLISDLKMDHNLPWFFKTHRFCLCVCCWKRDGFWNF